MSSESRKPASTDAPHAPRKGRFSINLVSRLANYGLGILVGLWLTPYLIRRLGVAAYGLVPLVMTVTSYMGLFTVSLNGAVGRFITIALDRQDYDEANRVFNTSFWGTLAILLLLLGPWLWCCFHGELFFNLPSGYERQFSWLFVCAMTVFFMTALGSSFSVSSFCMNRFDLDNLVGTVSTIIRVCSILLMFNLFEPKITYVGLALVIAFGSNIVLTVFVWRHLTPMLRLNLSGFSSEVFLKLAGMGGWIVVDQLGTILLLSIEMVVVNKVLGPENAGHYGAIMVWSVQLRSLSGLIGSVFAPTTISLYGQQQISVLVSYCRRAVKFVGLVMALPIGLICGFARPLLNIWLGPNFDPLTLLLVLMTLPLCASLPIMPLFALQVATRHVRIPGIVTLVVGLGNVGLAVLLSGPLGWGMYGVAGAGAIALATRNILFTPAYAAHILRIDRWTFYREVYPVVVGTLALAGTGWMLSHLIRPHTWFQLGLSAMAAVGIILPLFCRFLLTQKERGEAMGLLSPFMRNSMRWMNHLCQK
jgi:membrane protein EpsK